MARTTAARTGRNSANLLVVLLGTAVLLNYIDRGAIGIAAPVMTRELELSPQA